MNRRRFINISLGATAVTLGGVGLWFQQLENQKDLSINTLLITLTKMQKHRFLFTGEWKAFKILSHLSQSINYSMTGYPEHESDLFKSIVGKNAFAFFGKRGRMSHGLNAPIPGAYPLADDGDVEAALQDLIDTLQAFDGYSGQLQDHFAYGELTHAQYSDAHTMHIYNHFDELQIS